MKIKNISQKELCCACGACYSICPVGAIEFKIKNGEYKPFINDKCIFCGKCFEVCPFGKFVIKNDTLLGKFLALYKAKSKDKKILNSASSGGIVSLLLIYLFNKKYIDYAILVDFNSKDPIIAKGVIIKKAESVINCMGSKYQQVLINKLLKKVGKKDKFAIVGLPCHLKALNNYIKMKKLNGKNIYKIGLFCGHVVNFNHLDYFLKKLNITRNKIKLFKYRTKGWPGKILIETNKKKFLRPFSFFLNLYSLRVFTPKACLFCDDLTGEYSDISSGDAWGISQKKSSIIIVRNKKMLNILNKLKKEIVFSSITEEDVIKSQGSQLFFKKKNIFARVKLWNIVSKKKILYKPAEIKCSFIDYIGAILLFFNKFITVNLLLITPAFLLKAYAKIISYTTGFYYKRLIIKFRRLIK